MKFILIVLTAICLVDQGYKVSLKNSNYQNDIGVWVFIQNIHKEIYYEKTWRYSLQLSGILFR